MSTLTSDLPSPREVSRTLSAPSAAVRRATVVITSRNRFDDLKQAVASALAQSAVDEVIVIDDASDDGSGENIAALYPGVRVYQSSESLGYIALRNFGNGLSRNPFVVSIDDDAVFSRSDIVAEAIEAFGDPRIGAVAIPFINVNSSPRRLQQPPDGGAVYLTETFVGTAHVLRKSVFEALGGYRTEFIHQGEETDYCLRMADAGYRVCMVETEPILHFESPRRNLARTDFFGRRNDCLIALWNVPAAFLPWQLLATLAGGFGFAARTGKWIGTLRGLTAGFWEGLRRLDRRRPLASGTFRLFKRQRRLRGTWEVSSTHAD